MCLGLCLDMGLFTCVCFHPACFTVPAGVCVFAGLCVFACPFGRRCVDGLQCGFEFIVKISKKLAINHLKSDNYVINCHQVHEELLNYIIYSFVNDMLKNKRAIYLQNNEL